MPQKHRKKPVVVEATEFTGNNWKEIEAWSNGIVKNAKPWKDYDPISMDIKTPGDDVLVELGDYIVKENDTFYTVKPDVFTENYEEVTE